jgi:predicted nucleic acid-binding protein
VQFVDASVLLYTISQDPAEHDKAKRANEILSGRDLGLSVQVLQEFYVQATRASRPDPISHQHAVRLIESFRRFPVQDVTSAILMAALDSRPRNVTSARWRCPSTPTATADPGSATCRPRRSRPACGSIH